MAQVRTKPDEVVSTIYMTNDQRARFDLVKAQRAYVSTDGNKRTRRPTLRALLDEAVEQYLQRELGTKGL